MRGAVPPLPQHVLMAWCLAKYRNDFTFMFSSYYKVLILMIVPAVIEFRILTLM